MMSDVPPALMNGRVIPVTGRSATTTPMLMKAWKHSQAVIPSGQQRPERVGRTERGPDPGIGEEQEEPDDEARSDEPELLADDREDEVVPGVRQVEAAGELALAEPRAEDAAEAEGEQPLDRVEARCGAGPARGP